jgi:hypothetical protein
MIPTKMKVVTLWFVRRRKRKRSFSLAIEREGERTEPSFSFTLMYCKPEERKGLLRLLLLPLPLSLPSFLSLFENCVARFREPHCRPHQLFRKAVLLFDLKWGDGQKHGGPLDIPSFSTGTQLEV